MPRYYCDYCDAYLTHDSMAGRQQHMRGWRHRENYRNYYQQFYPQWVMQNQPGVSIQGVPMAGMPPMMPPGFLPPPPGTMMFGPDGKPLPPPPVLPNGMPLPPRPMGVPPPLRPPPTMAPPHM